MLASQPLPEDWKDALGLTARSAPELFSRTDDIGDVPHAGPIRAALRDIGADAVFCIEDVPTAVFFAAEDAATADIAKLHSDLWNQGLASVLAVVCGDEIRIYSLAAVPPDRHGDSLDDHCLIEVLGKVADAMEVRNLLRSMESGRYWWEHDKRFSPSQRVDGTLLGNLRESHSRLCASGLLPEASQALLMQAMFIAYLEDREVIGSAYIADATGGEFKSFGAILEAQRVTAFYALFRHLNRDINGDLFVKPCSFDSASPRLERRHLKVLATFRGGQYQMGQQADQGLLFWAYDFKLIPVELISAVYDQFLSGDDRAPKGQFHTPMHLAASVVSQLWDDPKLLPEAMRTSGSFLDPACGSGIFLAILFKRLCEHWRQCHDRESIPWRSLCGLIRRLTGVDVDASAVRVAAFGLYLALLEEVKPPDIRRLMEHGKMLPDLCGKTLLEADFFDVKAQRHDVVIGNPPWRSGDPGAVKWCGEQGLPIPDKQAAWGFIWKALQHLTKDGKLAMLLPAMPFLHTHSKSAVSARTKLLSELRVSRIVNYADLRRQLFRKAVQPTALFIGGANRHGKPYWFRYWTPKATPGFSATARLTISETDKHRLDTKQVADDPSLFNKRLWMTGPEDKLFRYLARFRALRATVSQYRHAQAAKPSHLPWTIGQGFKPAAAGRAGDGNYGTVDSEAIADRSFMPSRAFRVLSPDLRALVASHQATVHRGGFERGFDGPRVLVTQGAGRDRLRAAYTEAPFTFQHAIQAIIVPARDKTRAKALTAMLNSKLMFWFAFHASASIGSERPILHQDQLLDLPFPQPSETPNERRANDAAVQLAALVDEAKEQLDQDISPPNILPNLLDRLDRLTYEYFDLSEQEIVLVEDTVEYIAPSLQPSRTASASTVPLWRPTTPDDRSAYAATLTASLAMWQEPGRRISVALVALDDDLTVLRLRLGTTEDWAEYKEQNLPVGDALATVSNAMNVPLPGNLHRIGNLRVYAGHDLYIVKPNMIRFWTRSAARADVEDIIVDLAEWRED